MSWYRLRRWYKDSIWWFRHRFDPRHRYNIVRTELPPGYYDPETRILAAFFHATAEYTDDMKDVLDWTLHPGAIEAFTAATEWWNAHKDSVLFGRDDEAEWQECKRHMAAVTEHLRCMWYP